MNKSKNVEKNICSFSGITLVALVVTIIVLLILAGVVIGLTIGNDGLFTRVENAANTWKKAEINENEEMKKFEDLYDETSKNLELNGEGGNADTIKKAITEIDGNETKDIETTDKNGNKIVIPAGFKVLNPTEDVTKGIVIEDQTAGDSISRGNQFVWIPCTIDGSNSTLKYDRCAFTRDGWIGNQNEIGIDTETNSVKIVEPFVNPITYFKEKMTADERISVEKNGGILYRKI